MHNFVYFEKICCLLTINFGQVRQKAHKFSESQVSTKKRNKEKKALVKENLFRLKLNELWQSPTTQQ